MSSYMLTETILYAPQILSMPRKAKANNKLYGRSQVTLGILRDSPIPLILNCELN